MVEADLFHGYDNGRLILFLEGCDDDNVDVRGFDEGNSGAIPTFAGKRGERLLL
jgi:hypothetical protein